MQTPVNEWRPHTHPRGGTGAPRSTPARAPRPSTRRAHSQPAPHPRALTPRGMSDHACHAPRKCQRGGSAVGHGGPLGQGAAGEAAQHPAGTSSKPRSCAGVRARHQQRAPASCARVHVVLDLHLFGHLEDEAGRTTRLSTQGHASQVIVNGHVPHRAGSSGRVANGCHPREGGTGGAPCGNACARPTSLRQQPDSRHLHRRTAHAQATHQRRPLTRATLPARCQHSGHHGGPHSTAGLNSTPMSERPAAAQGS